MATCPECKRWRWLPVSEGEVAPRPEALDGQTDLIGSPETFGDGRNTLRHPLLRRAPAERMGAANPRTLSVYEVLVQPR